MTPPRRPVGRPRLDPDDESIDVHFRIPAKQYDAALEQATTRRVSLSDFIRQQLRRTFVDRK